VGEKVVNEKKLPPLSDISSIEKIVKITEHIGVTYAGMGPDFRVLVRKGRKKAQEYFRFFNEQIPVSIMVRELANIMQEYTQSGGVRPFGVSLLVAGIDDDKGPQLYQVDPSGSFFAWKAAAVGSGMLAAEDFLKKRYTEDIPLDDAIHRAIRIIKESFQGEMTEENIEIGIISPGNRFTVLTPEKIKDYLDEV